MFVKSKTLWIILVLCLIFFCGFTLVGNKSIIKPEQWSLARLEQEQGVDEAHSRIFIPVTQFTSLEPFEKENSLLWLKQEFRIPDDWLNEPLSLVVDYPLADAEFFINGQSLGYFRKGHPVDMALDNDLLKANRFNTLLIRLNPGGGFLGSINIYKEPVGLYLRWKSPVLYLYLPFVLAGLALLGFILSLIQLIRKKIPRRSIALLLYSVIFLFLTLFRNQAIWSEWVPLTFTLPDFITGTVLWILIPVFLAVLVFYLCLKKGRLFFIISTLLGGGLIYFLTFSGHAWLTRIPWSDQIPRISTEIAAPLFGLYSTLLMIFAFITDSVQQKRIRTAFLLGLLASGALLVPDILSFLAWGKIPFSYYLYISGVLPVILVFLRERTGETSVIASPETTVITNTGKDPKIDLPEPVSEEPVHQPVEKTVVPQVPKDKSDSSGTLLKGLVRESFPEVFFKGSLWDLGVCNRTTDDFSSHFFDYLTDSGKRLEAGCFLNLGSSNEDSGLLAVSLKGKIKELLQSGFSLSETVRDIDEYIAQAYSNKKAKVPVITGFFFRFNAGHLELTPVNGLPVLYRNARTGKVTVVRSPGDSNSLGRGFGSGKGIKSLKISVSGGDQLMLLHPSVLKCTTLSQLATLFRKINFRDIVSTVQTMAVHLDERHESELFYMVLQHRRPQ